MKENEYLLWVKDQKTLLTREFDEKCIFKASKKRLKVIQRELLRNSEWLRKK